MSSQSIQDGNGTPKKPKTDEDRISDLQEDVTTHILSLMPIKDAVRTSVLSRNWEHTWTPVQRIDIDDTVLYEKHDFPFGRVGSTKEKFVKFVERILFLSQNITSSYLTLSSHCGYDPDRIAAWICSLSTGNVKSITVDRFWGDIVALPNSLLLNDSLTNLELHLSCTFKVPARISHLNLKNLNLTCVEIINESSSCDTLTLAFPVLESFKLHCCRFLNVKMVEVNAPELTAFCRTFSACPRKQAQIQDDYSIKIVSTKLVEFEFSIDRPTKYIFVGQQVVNATLVYAWSDIEQEAESIVRHATVLLNQFSNLQELNIPSSVTKAIAKSTTSLSFTVFRHLERLNVYGKGIYAKGLFGLLHRTPKLKFLSISNLTVYDYDYDYTAVEPVPSCIKDQLVEFEYGNFGETSLPRVNFVNYLWTNGRVLKKTKLVLPIWIN